MRIGIVINSGFNVYNFRMGLIHSFLKSNHEVIVIAPNDDKDTKTNHTAKLAKIVSEYYDVPMDRHGSNPAIDAKLIYKLYSIYKKSRLDVVLHYTIKPNIYGTIAAKMSGIPCINNVTGLGTVFLQEGITSTIAKALYKLTFRFPQTVFFQNEDDQQLFIEQKLVRPYITDVLPGSGIDTEHFQPKGFKKNEVFTFLVIARVLYDKGILEYIEAIKILKSRGIEAKFKLLGKIEDKNTKIGIPSAHVRQWQNDGLIEYLGTVEDVRPIIHDADCVILPSYREGTPRTLLEAASLGKPIIATDVPGCRDTVQHNVNGLLCNAKDPMDLADKMEKILSINAEDLEQMGRNSRRLVEERFDQKIVIQKYENAIYNCYGMSFGF